jgi:hypothetical protein
LIHSLERVEVQAVVQVRAALDLCFAVAPCRLDAAHVQLQEDVEVRDNEPILPLCISNFSNLQNLCVVGDGYDTQQPQQVDELTQLLLPAVGLHTNVGREYHAYQLPTCPQKQYRP